MSTAINQNAFELLELESLKRGLGVPIGLVLLLAMMVLPIPPLMLDFFFTFSLAFSMMILLSGIYALRPLDFSSFPTVLLLATLLRLALNVASTRVVLLNGHQGGDAAGKVIQAFGEVVIGGNYAVGFVVFMILVIINFIVVTKGAGRISEVSARFTLDAMPGKQMAIDADLNSGIITQEDAVTRRTELGREADFYGAMDGASKFVRGDAIAGILILIINMVGGMAIGMFQHSLSFGQSISVYALLTIGDGLVAQIPSLLLSVAAAMMVTRVSKEEQMGTQVFSNILGSPKPIIISAGVMVILGLIPGMPHMAFVGLGIGTFILGYYLHGRQIEIAEEEEQAEAQDEEGDDSDESQDITWDDVAPVDVIGLEIGYRLIPLVDKEQSGEMMNRIKGVRRKLSQELGFLVPSVHIRDNLDLVPNGYRISISGVVVGEDTIYADKDMAINPGQVLGKLEGTPARDPAFGLDAIWIDKDTRQYAQTQGYTVVDSATVVATHLSKIIQEHSHQLIGHEEVQQMLNQLTKEAPKLVEDTTPQPLSVGVILKVLQNLLYEGISVRDFRTICETLSENGPRTSDPILLTESVRTNLGPMIVQQINGFNSELSVITLDPELEQILQKSLQASEKEAIMIEPGLAEKLQMGLRECHERQEVAGLPSVLIVSSVIRLMMAKFVRSILPNMSVLSYNEVPEDKQIKVVANIGNN